MKFANVMRYDPSLKMVRLFRVEWYTGRYGEGGYFAGGGAGEASGLGPSGAGPL